MEAMEPAIDLSTVTSIQVANMWHAVTHFDIRSLSVSRGGRTETSSDAWFTAVADNGIRVSGPISSLQAMRHH